MNKEKKYVSGPEYDRAPTKKNYNKKNKRLISMFINTLSFGYCKVKWKRLFRTIWIIYILVLLPILIDESNWIELIDWEGPLIILIIIPASIPFFLISYVLQPFMIDMD